jgi:serine/threonine-protein kinase
LSYTDYVIESGESASRPPKLGRYELITRIGQGGMAEVQLALQRGPAGFEKLVVVKLVHENLATQKAFVDMLLDEARVAALVKHPNVVDIYDLGEAEGRYFIAMEYLEGEPLLAVLRAGRDGRRLDVLSTARLIADTAEGLDAAHELRSMAGDAIELVHHDVSLGNIVVLYNGQVKLVDFGVAKASQSASPHTRVQGKFSYMAPEKLRGGPGDRRSDIWSLGCVLWESLTLRRLFRGSNERDTMLQVLESSIMRPSQVNGDVPADFDAIAMRALERDPASRYPTAKAMAADIEEVLRKHGYAAKNDRIAKYMQATFHSHIVARKKLLQEVSSKGRASPDVLEAAFHTGAMATGTPIVSASDLSAARRRPSDSLSGPLPGPITPLPDMRGVGDERTEIDQPAIEIAQGTGDELTEIDQPAIEIVQSGPDERTLIEPPKVARRKRWALVAAGLAVIGLAVALAALFATSADTVELPTRSALNATATAPDEPAAQLPTAARERAPESPEAASASAPTEPAAAQSGSGTSSPSEAPPTASHASHTAEPSTKVRPPGGRHAQASKSQAKLVATDNASPDELVRVGLQAYVAGDTRTALASYRRALELNTKYAPAWRCIGLAYDKLGEKTKARNAYQKYLELSPDAADAAGIRAKLESP